MNWDIIASILPSDVEIFPDGDESLVKSGDKELNIIWNDKNNSFTINGTTLHFQDVDVEIIGTILIPYILQQLDGERRI